MVSTVLCPRCKTKNSKTAEICYNCKKPLKPSKKSSETSSKKPYKESSKKPLLSYFNRESVDLKIIAIGTVIFVLSNVILLEIAEDYAVLISGFATLMFTYLVFKNYYKINETRSLEMKVLINYLIMALIGILVLVFMFFAKIIN
ncbi:zinc ribbon domain-containing protein [Methanobacterium oryzae]|uniref:zinc ribbon domain-containing protein n=1 Tax=Methanobacterium oryzae TaxID=69540 RepID=UPI003D1E9428